MTRIDRIKAQEEKVAAAARKLKEMKAAESKEQRKKRTHTLIQVGSIIEVVGIPLETSRRRPKAPSPASRSSSSKTATS